MSLLGSGSYHMTGRFARPLANSSSNPGAGEPKCQKCLQTGHWTYECKGQAAYRARASASKQLMNPAKRKYLNPEEVPEWMRYSKKELEEKQKQEAEARRKQRKKKHKGSSSSSSSGSDSSSSSGSDTTAGSTSGSSSSSGTTTSSSSSGTSSASGSTSSSNSDSSSSSKSSDSDRKSPPRKRSKRSAARPADIVDGTARARQHKAAVDKCGGTRSRSADRGAREGRYVRDLEPVEERAGTSGRSHTPPSPEGRRPDGRADGRAAAAAADREDNRDNRQHREDWLDSNRHQRSRSPSSAAAGADRQGSSPGRWGGGDERLQRQTSGALHAEQRLAAAAAGQRGRYVRSQVAAGGGHRDRHYDDQYRRDDRGDYDRRDRSGDGSGGRVGRDDSKIRARQDGVQYNRERSREPRHDHSSRDRQQGEPDGHRYQAGHNEQRRQFDRHEHEAGAYDSRQRYRGGRDRDAAPAAGRQQEKPNGRPRSPSRSLSRSTSPSTSASKSRSSGSSSSGPSGSSSGGGTSNSSGKSSSSGGRGNGRDDRRGAAARKPLKRGVAADTLR